MDPVASHVLIFDYFCFFLWVKLVLQHSSRGIVVLLDLAVLHDNMIWSSILYHFGKSFSSFLNIFMLHLINQECMSEGLYKAER